MSGKDIKSTPINALKERAARHGSDRAVIAGERSWTWRELEDRSSDVAASLSRLGLVVGDRIAVHMTNRLELLLAYLAVWKIGAGTVPLNVRLKPAEIDHILQDSAPRLYIGEKPVADDVECVLKERAIATVVIAKDGEWPQDLHSVNADQPAPGGMGDGDAPSLLLSTSGTTGDTKLVVWTQRQMSALEQSAHARGFGSGDRVLLMMPMMHGGGVAAFASCLLTGAQVVLIQSFSADAVLKAIGRYGCTSLMGLPFMWAQLAEAQLKRAMDVGSLRLCLSVGDVCPADTERAVLQSFGLPLLSFWASTEEPCAGIPGFRDRDRDRSST